MKERGGPIGRKAGGLFVLWTRMKNSGILNSKLSGITK
jgi:hypothetical protein